MKHTAWLPLALALALPAQTIPRPQPDTFKPPPGMVEKQSNDRNTDRQRRLQADTDKLLLLATDLKKEVDRTDKNILSIEVVRRAEEIERLAKSVKDRMKG